MSEALAADLGIGAWHGPTHHSLCEWTQEKARPGTLTARGHGTCGCSGTRWRLGGLSGPHDKDPAQQASPAHAGRASRFQSSASDPAWLRCVRPVSHEEGSARREYRLPSRVGRKPFDPQGDLHERPGVTLLRGTTISMSGSMALWSSPRLSSEPGLAGPAHPWFWSVTDRCLVDPIRGESRLDQAGGPCPTRANRPSRRAWTERPSCRPRQNRHHLNRRREQGAGWRWRSSDEAMASRRPTADRRHVRSGRDLERCPGR